MRVKDAVGRFGEQVAAERLAAGGVTILARNWRCRDGELDIVGQDGDCLVFVEVKTRSSMSHGAPAEAVSARKATRIRRLALQWLAEQRADGQFPAWTAMRFDVVSVLRSNAVPLVVEHLVGAF
ncbi:YraN family protein [uncultured Jatrophihabitans sp.]|uniref:YraN family protein n=1 Tax=uncultured Jatrophihabitans sp. TaxID=1610747 RepID=UPI0035CA2F50